MATGNKGSWFDVPLLEIITGRLDQEGARDVRSDHNGTDSIEFT
jgi:hypothetical protein